MPVPPKGPVVVEEKAPVASVKDDSGTGVVVDEPVVEEKVEEEVKLSAEAEARLEEQKAKLLKEEQERASAVKKLQTKADEDKSKMEELAKLQGDRLISEIPLGDPYWQKKRELGF